MQEKNRPAFWVIGAFVAALVIAVIGMGIAFAPGSGDPEATRPSPTVLPQQ